MLKDALHHFIASPKQIPGNPFLLSHVDVVAISTLDDH
jgi:hypothetical protein